MLFQGAASRPPLAAPHFLDEHNNENFDPSPPDAAARGLPSLSIATAAVAVAPPADDAKARVAAGKNRFDALCVSCHGAAGTGVAPGSSAAGYGPRLAGRTDLDPTLIHERIVRGKHGDKAMPRRARCSTRRPSSADRYVKLIAPPNQRPPPPDALAPFVWMTRPAWRPVAVTLPRPAPATHGCGHRRTGAGLQGPRRRPSARAGLRNHQQGPPGRRVMPPWGRRLHARPDLGAGGLSKASGAPASSRPQRQPQEKGATRPLF